MMRGYGLFNWWIASVMWMYMVKAAPPVIERTREYHAVAGGRTTLQCNITSPIKDDVVTLVLWYKGDVRAPFYTLDARRGPLERAKHFPSATLGRRFHFDLHLRQPGLTIDPVRAEDEGLYTCRVEYKRFRTLSYAYLLYVVVPPREAIIMDEHGQRIEETIGPVDEGYNITLICEADGGTPSPTVTWWRDSVLLDDSYHVSTQGYIRNEMSIIRVGRGDLLAAFTCQASNNNLTVPTSSSVTLDLNLKPLDVRIISNPRHLSAGNRVTLECESTGSRPRAVMTWWKANVKIQTGNEVISDNGNLTLSTLSFIPVPEDHGKTFTCTAENPTFPNSRMEDSRTVTVHYLPELRLALGASIQYTAIKEGSDVYFDCNVRANPWVHDVGWRFGDRTLISNTSAGIIVSNQSLVLQHVRKGHRGPYQCVASNSEGEGRSEQVQLDVQFAPVCKTDHVTVIGVSKFETVNVTCELEADPSEVTFTWILNSTVESLDVQSYVTEGTTSTVYYSPRTMLGYGVLLCWGTNSIGKQKQPCVYRIIPVGVPEALRNCLVTNQTVQSLVVSCDAGYDGGLQQTFHLEVYSAADENLERNLTADDAPGFEVKGLMTGQSFILVLYSSNVKGRSSSVALMATTLSPAERRTAEENDSFLTPMIGLAIGVGVALVIFFIIIAIVIRLQRRKKTKDSEEVKQEKCDMPLQNYKEESIDSTIESPDVIPSDTQVYISDANSIHMECARRLNDEMYQLLKQKHGNYENLIPMNDSKHAEIEDLRYADLSAHGYHTRPGLHMEPPKEYADVYRGERGVPLPVSDALDKRSANVPELPLISNMQQNTRDTLHPWQESHVDGCYPSPQRKHYHDERPMS